ncbi:MAG TPA: hopanoid biosynthesis-associated protein HpnK [Steroidobacteraceae bacterium]|jgi:hopanoid biosynthesis associated protein HpnK|nr:hopanoid biosynthesis-associated protein HpnK [Steroidobacteraceae bacterium]
MQRQLIVTADDFGLHEGVNEAVERASRSGILTAASLMVSAPAAADAVRRARRLPNLRVGLHLVLADGRASLPHQQIPGIADAKGHIGAEMFFRGVRYFSSASVRAQLEAEIRAQFAAFARTGLPLDHVNAHKHFHLHPTILGILIRVARECGARAMRVPDEPFWFAARGQWSAAIGNVLLRPWLLLMKHRLRIAGIFHNDSVFGIAKSGSMDEEQLLAILARLPRGVTEIYLHPAVVSGSAVAATMPAYRHADEFAALESQRVRETIAALNIRRGGYSDILLSIGRSLA